MKMVLHQNDWSRIFFNQLMYETYFRIDLERENLNEQNADDMNSFFDDTSKIDQQTSNNLFGIPDSIHVGSLKISSH